MMTLNANNATAWVAEQLAFRDPVSYYTERQARDLVLDLLGGEFGGGDYATDVNGTYVIGVYDADPALVRAALPAINKVLRNGGWRVVELYVGTGDDYVELLVTGSAGGR